MTSRNPVNKTTSFYLFAVGEACSRQGDGAEGGQVDKATDGSNKADREQDAKDKTAACLGIRARGQMRRTLSRS